MEVRGVTREAFHEAWLEAARIDLEDPARTAALALVLAKKLPIGPEDLLVPDRDLKRYAAFLARVAALGARSCDVETALALVAFVAAAPLRVREGASIYGPVLELINRIGAPEAIAPLEDLHAHPTADTATVRAYLRGAIPRLVAMLAVHGTPDRPPRSAVPTKDLDALLAATLAAPGDDAPRLVYADALLERGEPRGAFIQAQLAAPDDPKAGASLLRAHEKAWLGEVAQVSQNRIWRRGFLDELSLLQNAAADAGTWQRASESPVLATVRTLRRARANEQLYTMFVRSPALAQLRAIDVPSTTFARQLQRTGLDHLELKFPIRPSTLALVDGLVARLGVTRIAIETPFDPETSIDTIAKWPGRTRLAELTLVPGPRMWQPWYERSDAWLAAASQVGIPRVGAFAPHMRAFSS